MEKYCIKELIKENNKRYFLAKRDRGNILFSIYEWEYQYSIDEIKNALLLADIPDYLQNKYDLNKLLNEPLSIFNLEIINNKYMKKSILIPKNMSLWEYETFIKNDPKAPKALKMAFITQNMEDKIFYIACESYDYDSMVTGSNMEIVNNFVSKLYKEIEKLTNKKYSHIEVC